MSSFSDLPTEILLEIESYFSAFDDTTQVSLALACRRCYATFIDMVLKDQIMQIEKLSSSSKITPPIYNDPKYHRNNKNRSLAPKPPSEILLFDREAIGNSGTLKIVVSGMTRKELQSLRYLVSRTRHLKKLVLELYAITPGYNMQDVAFFINTCIAKPNLVLHIYGGPRGELESPFIFHFKEQRQPFNSSRRVVNDDNDPSIDTSVRSTASSFSVVPRKHKIHDIEPRISTLALEGGELPFMLPLYPVILNALRGSTITDLKLKWIPFSITLFHWGQILPCIQLPMLKELTIGKVSIAFPDILSLLERHPTIETLDLSHNNVIGIVKLPSKPILPRLVALIANSEYLLPFIEHHIQGHFPMLERLQTRPRFHILGMTDEFSYIENDLNPVYDLLSSPRIAKNFSKAFDLMIGGDGSGTLSGLVKWLLDVSSTVATFSYRNSDVARAMPLVGVRTLVIENADLWKSPEMTERLFEWFKVFRSGLDEGTIQKEGFMDPTYRDMFEVLIWKTCLHLEKLEIAGNKSVKRRVREL